MTPRSQRHRLSMNGRKSFLGGIPHGARRVVHRPQEHARERQSNVVLWVRICAPLAPLHTAHAFGTDQVGPSPRHYGRLLITMKVDKHLAVGRLPAESMIELDEHLVAALHEI